MTINHQPKAAMNAANGLDAAGPATAPGADTEVVAQARRRHFSNADKRRILAAADRCTKPGEIGALMRREGLYSSSLSTWRRQRDAVELAALEPQKRGPKADLHRAETLRIAQLTRDNERLQDRLRKALLVIEVQKKLAALLGHTLDDNGEPK
jgi:transposase-like protein